jgi:hypothetical protein
MRRQHLKLFGLRHPGTQHILIRWTVTIVRAAERYAAAQIKEARQSGAGPWLLVVTAPTSRR